MKKYLNLSLALVLFATGFALGRGGAAPELGLVEAAGLEATALPDAEGVTTTGSAGAALTWKQVGDQLQVDVVGSGAEFLGAAVLDDPNAWPDLGSGEAQVLHGGTSFSLDLVGVDQLTFYRLEAIGSLKEGVFRPCAELPAGCFAPRPPTPPPWPDLHHIYGSEH